MHSGLISQNGFSTRLRRRLAYAVCLCFALHGGASATADGPDFFKVQGIPKGAYLKAYSAPGIEAGTTVSIPASMQCLRNLGCQGGLSLEEFTTLSAAQRQARARAKPRWCKIDYNGAAVWVQARFLAESACTAPTAARMRFEGRIQGHAFVDHPITARAGQTLAIQLDASNRQNYFNLSAPGADAAMFVGSVSGSHFEAVAPVDGIYLARVYLMRAAARRNEVSRYNLQARLHGPALLAIPAQQDALVPGTPYHATARVPCKFGDAGADQTCDAKVIRRAFDGTATVRIERAHAGYLRIRQLLFIKGKLVSSDAPDALRATRQGDNTTVDVGSDEQFEIPDALVFGG